MDHRNLPKLRFDELLRLLAGDGYEVLGPRLEQGAIVYGRVESAADLPIGWTDRQSPGSYRLEHRGDSAYFGFAVGPHSWKKYLFPQFLKLWDAERTESGFEVWPPTHDPPRRALLGVRSCELHALAVQDRVFLDRSGGITDPHYAVARERLLLIAVECQHPAGTCFCATMGTGPHVEPENVPLLASRDESAGRQSGGRLELPLTVDHDITASRAACDLVLTELDDAFVVHAASAAGERLLERLSLGQAATSQIGEAKARVDRAAGLMENGPDVTNVRPLLHDNPEHPRWDDVAARCLTCTNCTMVCPTCFCSATEDVTDLTGNHAERVRRWDSCFNPEFARVHGGNFRPAVRSRYRQWLTHKFASWFDQFDTSGCVGCGRCITWCPAGIDVREEIAAIRAEAQP